MIHKCEAWEAKIGIKVVTFLSWLAEIFSPPSWPIFEKYFLLTERLHFLTGYVQSIIKAAKNLKTRQP